jgi:hypothetical protein
MSVTRFLRQVAAGAFAVNAVPHAVSGLRGQPFPTPFADPPGRGLSSPTANVVWGGANLALAGMLRRRSTAMSARLPFALGAFGIALVLAQYFASVPALQSGKRRRR